MQFTKSLCENRRFRALYNKGKTSSGRFIAVYTLKARQKDTNHVGITVSTKVGNAVVRNKIRRRLKEAYRINEGSFSSGYDIVLVARGAAAQASFAPLHRELVTHFKKLGIIRDEGEKI